MNPFKFNSDLLNNMADTFSVERNGAIIGSAKGFFCGKDYPSTIQLVENIDVQDGDWLTHSITNRKYYAKKTEPITMHGEIIDLMVQYLSESEYEHSKTSSNSNIHIHSVNGPAIIGNQQNAVLNVGNTISDIKKLVSSISEAEQEEFSMLISELEKIETSNHPILVEGSLSKFSNLLKKHSDLLIALGGWAVQLLVGK